MGRPWRLRNFLRPPIRGVHQHGLQQLSFPARTGGDLPGEHGPDRRSMVSAGSGLPFSQYLPNRIVRIAAPPARIRSATTPNVTRGADGTVNPVIRRRVRQHAATSPKHSNSRAVDRNLHTPYVQQYHFGVKRDLGRNTVLEVRYVGTRGDDLLEGGVQSGLRLNAPEFPTTSSSGSIRPTSRPAVRTAR